MSSTDEEVLRIFRESKALLTGHFVLRSGLHSGHFFQCAQVCQHMDKVTRLIELLRPRLVALRAETVLAPAMGGLVVGQEVARQLKQGDERHAELGLAAGAVHQAGDADGLGAGGLEDVEALLRPAAAGHDVLGDEHALARTEGEVASHDEKVVLLLGEDEADAELTGD
ncbi:MAG: hypothetical protein ACKOQ9_08935, partial [Verrucomicrobiota bacterium]